jgi:cytochrome P450
MSAPDKVDFDHHSEAAATDAFAIYAELRKECPVSRSDAHGGFWAVADYADQQTVLRDHGTYSSRHDTPYREAPFGGTQIPALPFRLSMVEMDPPDSTQLRRLVQKVLSRRTADSLEPRINEIIAACLAKRLDSGSIEFVDDLVNQVPARVILELSGLPAEDWKSFAGPQHEKNHTAPGTPEREAALAGLAAAEQRMRAEVRARRAHPQDDLISMLANSSVGGSQIAEDEAVDLLMTFISGGLGTVTGVMAHSLHYLSAHTAVRDALLADRSLVPAACEEFFRYFTPSRGIARTVTQDTVLSGQELKRGDRVLLLLGSANHDPKVFDDPETLDIRRAVNPHITFGVGVHRCAGAPLARTELRCLISKVLDLIPDYTIDIDQAVPYPRTPVTIGFESLPATFTPPARH